MSTAQSDFDDFDEGDGSTGLSVIQSPGLAGAMERATIDGQIATAKKWPRNVEKVVEAIYRLATKNDETAEMCVYALPRGNKAIKGPSIRFAEIVVQLWGNCRTDAKVVDIDRANKMVVAEGMFHDLESNTATKATTNRRIVNSRGGLYSDDMIIVTGNAACSIARRNAILSGVPQAVWADAYEKCESMTSGDIKTLVARREKAVKAFARFGVKPEQIFVLLDVANLEGITLEHMPTLLGAYNALKAGDTTVEQLFGAKPGNGDAKKKGDLDAFAEGDKPKEEMHDKTTGEIKDEQKTSTDEKKPADDKAAPAAQSAGPTAQGSDKPASESPAGSKTPTTEAEYEAAAIAFIDAFTGTAPELSAWYTGDKALRNACGVGRVVRDRVAKKINDKFPEPQS